MNELIVGLNAWIIQDGNYGEFTRGESYKLAVEFNSSALAVSEERTMRCEHKEKSLYNIVAKVVFSAPKVWVIDFGVKVFCESRPPRFATVGQWVQGEIWTGIDSFFYKERLYQMPCMPNLFVDWCVTRIQLETTPWVQYMSSGSAVLTRDPTREEWVERITTDAWTDDNGRADYLLSLSK